jgi:hypothetical protein
MILHYKYQISVKLIEYSAQILIKGNIEGNEDKIPIKGQIDGIRLLKPNLKAFRRKMQIIF